MLKLSEILLEALPGEKSAGAIIFNKNKVDGIRYLLLFGDKIGWGFPKGHLDGEETPKEAAIREVEEETGIIIDRLITNFEVYTQYKLKFDFSKTPPKPLKKAKNKIVVLYLAETKSKEVVLSHEHKAYKWVSYKEAQELLKFNNDVLKKANGMISNETR